MLYQDVLHSLAIVILVCVVIVGLVDLGETMGNGFALRVKWSLLWYGARYVGIVCAVLLALDVLF